MPVQSIYSGAGAQSVEVYALDAQGRLARPSSATVQIVDLSYPDTADDADRIILASTSATVETTSTTSTAAAGPRTADARKIAVASATGFVVGRMYQIASGGKVEAFELARVDGTDLYARDLLREYFGSGATVQGLRVTGTFPSGTADDEDQLARDVLFGVDWTFVGVTGPTQVRTLARIERRGKAIRATAADLLLLDSQLASSTHSRVDLESHLRHADRELDALLLRRGDSLPDTSQGEIGRLAVTWRALSLAYRVLGPTHEQRAIWASKEAQRWISMVLDGHQPRDAVETTRTADQARPRRSRLGISVI